jgi:hypothetical protein
VFPSDLLAILPPSENVDRRQVKAGSGKRRIEEQDKGETATLDASFDMFKTDRNCGERLFS